jgi:hypothetical protein
MICRDSPCEEYRQNRKLADCLTSTNVLAAGSRASKLGNMVHRGEIRAHGIGDETGRPLQGQTARDSLVG